MNENKTNSPWNQGLEELRQMSAPTFKLAECAQAVAARPTLRWSPRVLTVGASAAVIVACGTFLLAPRDSAAQQLNAVAKSVAGIDAFSMRTTIVYPDGRCVLRETNEMDGSRYRLWMGGHETTVSDGKTTAWVDDRGFVTTEAQTMPAITASDWIPKIDSLTQGTRVSQVRDTFNGMPCYRFDILRGGDSTQTWSVYADKSDRLIGIKDVPNPDGSVRISEFRYEPKGFLSRTILWPNSYRIYNLGLLRATIQHSIYKPIAEHSGLKLAALLLEESGRQSAVFVGNAGSKNRIYKLDTWAMDGTQSYHQTELRVLFGWSTIKVADVEVKTDKRWVKFSNIPVTRVGNIDQTLIPWTTAPIGGDTKMSE